MVTFDISLAFDKAEYLNPQIYLFFNTLENNIPEDCTIHIITNRDNSDKVIQWLKTKKFNTKWYYKEPYTDLKSRCQYMFHSFEVDSKADYIIKMELDTLTLKNINCFKEILQEDYDIYITPESRRMIVSDNIEKRIWNSIYRRLGITCPIEKITYTEGKIQGLPLYDTTTVMVKNKYIKLINDNWVPMTKICEDWIQMGVHPNEFAFTALIHKFGLKCKLLDKSKYDFNPISHFRKNPFPSQELIDNPKIPDDVILLQYHRPWWLKKLYLSNKSIKDIVDKSIDKIGKDWLETSVDTTLFQEK